MLSWRNDMFGERLKELRKKNGYTQVSLASELGVSKGTIAMWEVGKRKPDFETLCNLSEFFDVRTDYILGQSDDDSSITLTIENINQLGAWKTEKRLKELFELYLSIDTYGKSNIENLIRSEANRCKDQGTTEDISGIQINVIFDK